jgi:hypothetical protein
VMRTEAVSGQYLDLLSSQRHPGDEPGARRVARLKSGSYTVEGPLLVGAALAGASPAVEGVLRRYGGPLGEAFQLRDDVLGTFGDPSVTGKDGDTDVLQGKRTVLVAKAWQLGSAEVRRLIAERLGREDLTPAEVEEVRSAIRSSGALAETIALIESARCSPTVPLMSCHSGSSGWRTPSSSRAGGRAACGGTSSAIHMWRCSSTADGCGPSSRECSFAGGPNASCPMTRLLAGPCPRGSTSTGPSSGARASPPTQNRSRTRAS